MRELWLTTRGSKLLASLLSFQDRGEEAVAGVDAWDSAEVRAAGQGHRVGCGEFSGGLKAIEFRAAVETAERSIAGEHLLDHLFVFFFLQRTR